MKALVGSQGEQPAVQRQEAEHMAGADTARAVVAWAAFAVVAVAVVVAACTDVANIADLVMDRMPMMA